MIVSFGGFFDQLQVELSIAPSVMVNPVLSLKETREEQVTPLLSKPLTGTTLFKRMLNTKIYASLFSLLRRQSKGRRNK